MVAPGGAPDSTLNVRVWGGESTSVAVAANVSKVPAATFVFGIAAKTGAVFENLFGAPGVACVMK